MDFIAGFKAFLDSPVGISVYTAFALVAVRVILGIYAAAKDNTFTLSAVGSFIRSQILGRVMPFATVSFFAFQSGNVALMTTAGAIGAAFVAESIGAIQESLSETAKNEAARKLEKGMEIGNEVPTD